MSYETSVVVVVCGGLEEKFQQGIIGLVIQSVRRYEWGPVHTT